jgi:hypothetical protein
MPRVRRLLIRGQEGTAAMQYMFPCLFPLHRQTVYVQRSISLKVNSQKLCSSVLHETRNCPEEAGTSASEYTSHKWKPFMPGYIIVPKTRNIEGISQ